MATATFRYYAVIYREKGKAHYWTGGGKKPKLWVNEQRAKSRATKLRRFGASLHTQSKGCKDVEVIGKCVVFDLPTSTS